MTLTDSKLNVTTVERQARMEWTWVTVDAMRCGVPCGVAVKWCGDATWVNDQQITDNDAAIQKQHNTAFRKDRRHNRNKKRQNHKLLSVSAPESPPLKWFRGWGVRHVSQDLVLCTFFVPKHRTITKQDRTAERPDRLFSFCLPLQFPLQLWFLWKSVLFNINVFNSGVKWLLGYCEPLGFRVSNWWSIYLLFVAL